MKVYVGFSTTNSIASQIVRWFTHSPVSHCWLLVDESDCPTLLTINSTVIEAACTGVRERPYWDFLRDLRRGGKLVALIDPGVDMTAGAEFARWCIGDGYAWTEDAGDAGVIAARQLGRVWHNFFYHRRRWNCSQLVARALQYSDYPGSEGWYCPDMTPADIYRAMKGRCVSSLPVGDAQSDL